MKSRRRDRGHCRHRRQRPDELFSALSGERLASEGGAVVIDGEAGGLLSVTDRRRMGAAFVPEEPPGHGAAPR